MRCERILRVCAVMVLAVVAVVGLLVGLPNRDAQVLASPPPAEARRPSVLIIGDSTTVHMISPFRRALDAARIDATIDARSGRTTRQGRAVLARYDVASYDYVVVLLGANGRRENALRDMRALRAMGVDTMATVQAPRQAAVNRAVTKVFGPERITWAGYAKRHGVHTTDRKHYTPRDYQRRADFISRQIAARAR